MTATSDSTKPETEELSLDQLKDAAGGMSSMNGGVWKPSNEEDPGPRRHNKPQVREPLLSHVVQPKAPPSEVFSTEMDFEANF